MKTLPLGLVVYFWGLRSQDRLLTECLGPLAVELAETAERFWFGRYDARGPHVLAVWHVGAESFAEISGRVAARVELYLEAKPSTDELSRAELEKLHAGCRGGVQCEADAQPGLATNNTFHIFEHRPRDFPFWLSLGLAAEDELWQELDRLAFWTLDQLAAAPDRGAAAAAVRWVAAMDRELCHAGADAGEYWRYHASTLLLTLEEQLATDEERILALLPRLIGEDNHRVFSRVWAEGWKAERDGTFPDLSRVVEIVLSSAGNPRLGPFELLRAIDHFSLKQLGLAVSLHLPMILFAWHRHLAPVAAPP